MNLNPKKGSNTKPKSDDDTTELTAAEQAEKERQEADAAAQEAADANAKAEREEAEAQSAEAKLAEANAKLAEAERLAQEAAENRAKAEEAQKRADAAAAATLIPPASKTTAAPAPEGAKMVEPEKVPTWVRSKSGYSYTDPETKQKIYPDKPTKLPYVSSWVRSQLQAGFVGKTDGNGEFIEA